MADRLRRSARAGFGRDRPWQRSPAGIGRTEPESIPLVVGGDGICFRGADNRRSFSFVRAESTRAMDLSASHIHGACLSAVAISGRKTGRLYVEWRKKPRIRVVPAIDRRWESP